MNVRSILLYIFIMVLTVVNVGYGSLQEWMIIPCLFLAFLLLWLFEISPREEAHVRPHLHPQQLVNIDHYPLFYNVPDLQQQPRSLGVEKGVIDSLPLVSFSGMTTEIKGCIECPVCLSEFKVTEKINQLPNCGHAFHINCIGQWLEDHLNCPLCRGKIVGSGERELEVVVIS